MQTQSDVPFSLDDINPAWLTGALRQTGVIQSEEVVDFTKRPVGEDTGFNGEVVILSLQYSESSSDAPTSMVLKIPSASKNRIIGQTMGLYEKEIRSYRHLIPELNVRTPRHYYSALDVADDPDVVLERMIGLNKLPMWLIGVLSLIAQWVIARTPRKYVLLIEDLSGYRMGDQMQTCSDRDIRCVLRSMAKLHAQYWGSESLNQMSWVQPLDATIKIVQMMYMQAVGKYQAANAASLSDRQLRIVSWLKDNGMALTDAIAKEPQTILHGDMRLDNFCFDDKNDEVMLLDWQLVMKGGAGMDLAYFLSASVPLTASEAEINDYIEYYRAELNSHGVEISAERMRWQYEVGMLAMLQRILPTLFQQQMDLGSDRGPQMIAEWVEKIFKKVEEIDFETILQNRPD